jgi:hypothetical protein
MDFSFSAPMVSEEMHASELASFTTEELAEIHSDINGRMPENVTTRQDQQINTDALYKALDAIPDSSKSEYTEALERSPVLVELESPIVAFLRCENYDCKAAAERLVGYWRVRKHTFGPDRAFLPMTLQGAMQDEDVDLLNRGLIRITSLDKFGRVVFFVDRVKYDRSIASREAFARCMFYMLHVISERDEAQVNGVVGVNNMRGADIYKHFDRILMKRLVAMMSFLPIKLCALHDYASSHSGSCHVYQKVLLPVVRNLLGKRLRHRLVVHNGSNLLLQDQFGIGPECLASELGGSFSLDDFHKWLEKRNVQDSCSVNSLLPPSRPQSCSFHSPERSPISASTLGRDTGRLSSLMMELKRAVCEHFPCI